MQWPAALITVLTTMMVGGNGNPAAGFQYSATANLEFFLTQCRASATVCRVQVLPLANVPQWRDVNGVDGTCVMLALDQVRHGVSCKGVWVPGRQLIRQMSDPLSRRACHTAQVAVEAIACAC